MGTFSSNAGALLGRTLLHKASEVGGSRFVFVKLQGSKNELVSPTSGMKVLNPFKGEAKAYAGDLVEYKMDGTGYLLKSFELADTAEAAATDYYFVRDGYHHIPFVGDVIMKAPSSLSGTGAAYAITAVEATQKSISGSNVDVWKVTVGTTIGAASKGDVFVEGAEAGAAKKALVTNPNMVLASDFDFLYAPATGDEDFDGARYIISPILSKIAYINRMSPIPPAVKALNKSRVVGWFQI